MKVFVKDEDQSELHLKIEDIHTEVCKVMYVEFTEMNEAVRGETHI